MEETMKALVAGNGGYSRKDFGFEHQQHSSLNSTAKISARFFIFSTSVRNFQTSL
jgi:hypothetical protein